MKRIFLSLILATMASFVAAAPAFAGDEDMVRFGNNIELAAEDEVDGDLVAIGGNIVVGGRVTGDTVAVGGNVDVSGEVLGSVVSVGGNVHLAPTAQVQRDVVVTGGVLQREPGAQIRGDIVEVGPAGALGAFPLARGFGRTVDFANGFGWIFSIVSSLILAVALIAVAILAVVLFPTQVGVVRQTIELAPMRVLGVGVLSALLVPVLSLVLVITCIGLPIFWVAVMAATLFGTVGLAVLIGERLLLAVNVTNFTLVSAAAAGILAIWVASLLPILGGILLLFVSFFALGAVVLSRFGTVLPPGGQPTTIR